jgi:hypothetical protein
MFNQSLWAYPAIAATIISITGLTWLARALYDAKRPRTLSEMATISPYAMLVFRLILFTCSILFGLTIVLYIAPRTQASTLTVAAGLTMCLSEMVLAIIPARGGRAGAIHNLFGYLMGISMFILVTLFALSLRGLPHLSEVIIAGIMITSFGAMLLDRPRFVLYELTYIYLSHTSIVIMALSSLRI